MNLKNPSMAGAIALLACSVFALSGAMVFSSLGNTAQASIGVGGAASAVASAAVAQGGGERTIVWYGVTTHWSTDTNCVYRAWSDGTVELKRVNIYPPALQWCGDQITCQSSWIVVATPQQGLAAFSDLNADQKVDAVDLAEVLSRWGDAPRNEIPPSECPLNLINP